MTRTARNFDELLVLEDNAATAERERIAGVRDGDANFAITVRVHHLNGQRRIIAARKTYSPGSLRSNRNARIQIASTMLSRAAERGGDPVVIAGTSYGSAAAFFADVMQARSAVRGPNSSEHRCGPAGKRSATHAGG
jgi:hypothetical protein